VKNKQQIRVLLLLTVCAIFISCSGPKKLADNAGEGFKPSPAKASHLTDNIPNYELTLSSLKGKGRAIVSEPGNTERVTVLFSSNRNRSLVTVRNNIGIEGGQLLTDGDTLLVYNKVDKFARKIPVRGGKLDRINQLASLNILDLLNYSFSETRVESIKENKDTYKLQLSSGTEVYVDKKSYLVKEVVEPEHSSLPYSKIIYDAYGSIQGFKLPRRISIFGAEKKSKVALQVTGLVLNPKLDTLTINLPDDIPVYYR
jgi:hypothetical protein